MPSMKAEFRPALDNPLIIRAAQRLAGPVAWMWRRIRAISVAEADLDRLRVRRDMGGATIPTSDHRRPRTRLLGSPVGFAWRSSRLVLGRIHDTTESRALPDWGMAKPLNSDSY